MLKNTLFSKFEERYKNLNDEQKKAVDTIEGPVLVIAGPGSGKTEILSLRVANILKQTDTAPGSILCLTFTDNASLNMRDRLAGLIGRDAYRVGIHTFHSFCTEIISRYPEYFFEHADFHPADEVTRLEILSDLFREMSFDNPLRSEHPDQGYVFLKSSLSSISDLKRAGITPEEFKKVIAHNEELIEKINPILVKNLPERISKKEIEKIESLYEEIKVIKCSRGTVSHLRCLNEVFAESLLIALEKSKEIDSSVPLSEWKKTMIAKDENGNFIMKDAGRLPKMKALVDLYERYQNHIKNEGYFDFDDMILEVVKALEKNKLLAQELQESFQYILVDEFQDTNDAQMRLLLGLTGAKVNEGRPNIMAVGDDDQAIYKFQGAEVANIITFTSRFKNPAIITLNKNYRSTQDILDVSEMIISQGTESLRTIMPEIEKHIRAANTELPKGAIYMKSFETPLDEYQFIAKEIKKIITEGVSPDCIAVISRKHDNLVSLVPFFFKASVPVRYEKRQNVLKEPLIREITTMLSFVRTVAKGNTDEADEYLPTILSFPFWQLNREDVWGISIEANSRGKNKWLETMKDHANAKVRDIASFLINLGVEAQSLPLERLIDLLIGSGVLGAANPEDDNDEEDSLTTREDEQKKDHNNKKESRELGIGHGIFYTSPFRNYYFSSETFIERKAEYISFLSSLRIFIEALRKYRQNKVLTIEDCMAFLYTYEKNNMELLDTSPYAGGEKAVSLLTAHKAKGLEYEYVFVVSANDEIWSGREMPDKLPFPKNIHARPSLDSIDDKLRLLYVALTRAKHTLYVTYYEHTNEGKMSLPVEFLSPVSDKFIKEIEKGETNARVESLETAILSLSQGPYAGSEIAMLKDVVVSYQMSVTHLNNFLNIVKGGPPTFLEQNLLHFPQAKTVSGVYGTAIHSTIQYIYVSLKRDTVVPELSIAQEYFEKQIIQGRLHPIDHAVQIERGRKVLKLFLETFGNDIKWEDKIETDFKHQGVCVGDARVTGKIDKMEIKGSKIIVTDFKTGKAKKSWDVGSSDEKIQILGYRRQLLFYKILVEGSKNYNQYQVDLGILQFLEPVGGKFTELSLELDLKEVDRLKLLIEAVFKKIIALDFPDTSKYTTDISGCYQFEEDLIEGKI